jgi:hypothetical protein
LNLFIYFNDFLYFIVNLKTNTNFYGHDSNLTAVGAARESNGHADAKLCSSVRGYPNKSKRMAQHVYLGRSVEDALSFVPALRVPSFVGFILCGGKRKEKREESGATRLRKLFPLEQPQILLPQIPSVATTYTKLQSKSTPSSHVSPL